VQVADGQLLKLDNKAALLIYVPHSKLKLLDFYAKNTTLPQDTNYPLNNDEEHSVRDVCSLVIALSFLPITTL